MYTYMYIYILLNPWRKKKNVTSGEVRCSEWTPIYIKKTNLSLINKVDQRNEKKNKGLDIEQIYGHGSERGPMPGVSAPASCRQ
jgi:hypothetical protein